MTGAETLNAILICGIMGVIGQGIRAAVGLRSTGALANAAPSAQSEFSAAYFGLSLMIGFIAGVIAGLAANITTAPNIDFSNTKFLLAIVAAGYAGADFIENSLSIMLPGSATTAASTPAVTAAAAPSPILTPAAAARMPPAPAFNSTTLSAAFGISAPRVNTGIWTPALLPAFAKFDVNTPQRVAAAVGQFLVEAGAAFQELEENLNYTTAARVVAMFHKEIPTTQAAQPFLGQPAKLANFVYANRNGNGDVRSGDGYLFRGRGLIQLTGRNEYRQFGETIGRSPEEAAAYCATPEGAAMSGCWYLSTRGCLPFADSGDISEITRRVNGSGMVGETEREKYATAFLKNLGGQ